MFQMVRVFFIITLLLTSCEAFDIRGFVAPTGDTVDSRFEQSMSHHNNKAVATIDVDEAYTFYVCADPHINNTYHNLREFTNRLRNSTSASFGIILGDCTDHKDAFQKYVEAIEYVEDVQDTYLPIFSLIGNHDVYFNGWSKYFKLLGASVYWFDVKYDTGCDLFIALDSASGTLGKKQIKWLKDFLTTERRNYRHCIVLTHTNLFYTDNSQQGSGNLALEETTFLTELFSQHNVTLCLQGHDHHREDLLFGGVRYTVIGAIRDDIQEPEYLIIHISNSGVEYQWEYIK